MIRRGTRRAIRWGAGGAVLLLLAGAGLLSLPPRGDGAGPPPVAPTIPWEARDVSGWKPPDLSRIVRTYGDSRRSDREVALAILRTMDERMTWYRGFRAPVQPAPSRAKNEYAWLVSAHLLFRRGAEAGPVVAAVVPAELADAGFTNVADLKRYVVVAQAIAGTWGETTRETIDGILRDPDADREDVLLALRGLPGHVDVLELPALVRLSADPWTRIVNGPGDRTHMYLSVREYPVRDAARIALDELGVPYSVERTPDPDYPDDERLRYADLTIDGAGLAAWLRTRVESPDPETWRPAVAALAGIDVPEVRALVTELRKSLPPEKASRLEDRLRVRERREGD